MSLKSLVNKSVIKSDLRRFWYMGALFLAMLLVTTVLPLMNYEKGYREFDNLVVLSTPMVIFFGIVIPAIIFSYMHSKSSAAMSHSLPLRRECLYLSHIISSWILMVIPIVITTLILLTVEGPPPSRMLEWAGHELIYTLLMTSFGTLSAMITGNIFASIVLPFIVILLPLYVNFIGYALCQYYLYGYVGNEISVLFLYAGLKGVMLYIYPAIGIACYIIGFICYRKRAIENHSRLVTFNVLNHIFLYGFALCLGFLGYIYVCTLNGMDEHMWIALPFGIIGIIAARMLINRSFKPGNIIKPVIIYAAMMLVIYAFVGLDITGYEKRVPNIDDIEYAIINENQYSPYSRYDYFYDTDYSYYAREIDNRNRMYEKDDIEKVIALHRGIIDKNDDSPNFYIPIKYHLKNGRTLERQYHINKVGELEGLYNDVMNTVPAKTDRFPILAAGEGECTSAQVVVCGTNRTNLTNEQIDKITKALKEDITEADYSELNGDTMTSINIPQRMPSFDKNEKLIDDKNKWVEIDCTYNIHPVYKRTIALLTEWGLYNKMPSIDEIDSISLGVSNNPSDVSAVVDKTEIENLIGYLRDNEDKLQVTSLNNAVVTVNYANGSTWRVYLEQLPE